MEDASGDHKLFEATVPTDGERASGPVGAPQGSFSHHHLWGNHSGTVKINLNWDVIRYNSCVFVSASETSSQDVSVGGEVGQRILGAARVTVHNVSPRDGAVSVWVEVEWGSPLPISLDYLVIP